MDFKMPNNKSIAKVVRLICTPTSMRLIAPNIGAIDKPPKPGSLISLAYSKNNLDI
jgi:hypothetical protein